MEITLSTLQKLARNKAPVVGIPRANEKPFAVERSTLAGLIEGLETCEISLNTHLEIRGQRRYYKISSLNMQRWAASYKMLRAWAARQRVKNATHNLSREECRKSELLRKIALSERKAGRLRVHYRPYNPALAECGHLREENARLRRLLSEHGISLPEPPAGRCPKLCQSPKKRPKEARADRVLDFAY